MNRLEMRNISKSFAGVPVLHEIDLTVEGGQVHALLGENGAGKSTLMKILTGAYRPDSGEIRINGRAVPIHTIADAQRLGIGMIHQELSLFPNLSIAENFLIGNEDRFSRCGIVDYRRLYQQVREVLEPLDLRSDPALLVRTLGVGEQQLVEIGKALQRDVRFLIMDEPTSALTETETEKLFGIIRSLTQRGVGVIYISHRMEELYQIADTVSVLRDGSLIATKPVSQVNEHELISMMVGRSVDNRYPRTPSQPGDVLLQAEDVATHAVHGVTLQIRAGEIVGLGGLMGSGRTEVARALAGVDRVVRGRIEVRGRPVTFMSPADAIRCGIALVTEDRKTQGLLLPFSVQENLALPTLSSRSRLGWVLRAAERQFAQTMVQQLRIKVHSPEQRVVELSGGNQQKVAIGKWLATHPDVFILDEPTRGIDVGAKQEIYHLMNDMKASGRGILMISSDLPELLGLCDRIYVMHERTVRGMLSGDHIGHEAFMRLATGGDIA